ncbi:phosphatidylethanolamine binding protein 4 L homeolog isoform X2 [Xenopus laevis]|uniref:Phosphatidylethanolamine binding protein 4 L homeolog isoform X2 n=1 Tax=Xenopus laevis TaxID=8355 RepID=A0A8J0UNQ5_XENLA|nr:phosphatidylethanolamine binding protein 4 L homeolog isoform X2 [Xenopus laevis]
MARLWFLLLGILSLTAHFNTLQAEECSIRKLFNGEDEKFCSKGLDIIYSDIGLVSCIYIPNCFDFSWSLSKVWEHPLVRYSKAQPGWQLISGQDLTGIDISAYHRPSPPPGTGYHRYQFYLYEQPIGIQPYLLPEESRRSTWDFEAFVARTKLGKPLATTQFMAMSHIQ